MLNFLSNCNAWFGKRMFYVVLVPLLLGFIAPVETTKFWTIIATLSFSYMTFAASLEIRIKDFLNRLSKPWLTLWMLLFIHGVMPLSPI
nr:hypothetical protein [Desulforamulus aquiferis]